MLRDVFRGVGCGEVVGDDPVRSTTQLVFALVDGKLYMSAKSRVLVPDSGLSDGRGFRSRFEFVLGDVDVGPSSVLR